MIFNTPQYVIRTVLKLFSDCFEFDDLKDFEIQSSKAQICIMIHLSIDKTMTNQKTNFDSYF